MEFHNRPTTATATASCYGVLSNIFIIFAIVITVINIIIVPVFADVSVGEGYAGDHLLNGGVPAGEIYGDDMEDYMLASWGINFADKSAFLHGFIASFAVIIVSEIGDKTFFIAAIMAMRHPRLVVFSGALSALGFMTVLSVALGYATTIIPRYYTHCASIFLFLFFGLKLLKEGWCMLPDEGQEELEEVQAELKKAEEDRSNSNYSNDIESGPPSILSKNRLKNAVIVFVSPIFLQAFTLTFLAEWGDRSQITTIILGARENPLSVSLGGTFGHAICTGMAVIGGQLLAKRISVRTVTLLGGVVFLIFAATSLLNIDMINE